MDRKLWMHYWRRAVWIAWLLRFVPFVRMVGLNGSLVTGKFTPESDIDFFVVVKEGHLYTGRVLVALVVGLTGWRRRGNRIAGHICLNRFAIDTFLDITEHNDYHARVFHNLIPLYSTDDLYEKYCTVNAWMSDMGYAVVRHRAVFDSSLASWLIQGAGEGLFNAFGSRIEQYVRQKQHARIAADVRAEHPQSKVVANDKELKFHLAKHG